MKSKKNKELDLSLINQKLTSYTYSGYDLYFLHGWFAAYLSAPNDSEEDLLIPDYLIVEEEKITDEQLFSKLIDELVVLYSAMAESLFEGNKPIKPLVDFSNSSFYTPSSFSKEHMQNLLKWLYGYLAGFMAIGIDTESINDESLMEQRFYPALFTLCISLFYLDKSIKNKSFSKEFDLDYQELLGDLKNMWESQDGEDEIEQTISDSIAKLDLADVATAINDIFYVIRKVDETKAAEQPSGKLLGQLTTRH